MGKPVDRNVTIKAYTDHSEEHGVRFEMYDDLYDANTPTMKLKFSKNDEGMYTDDWHRVTFRLANQDTLHLKFASEKRDALWVAESDDPTKAPPCPKRRPTKTNTAMKAHQVKDYELIAHNSNHEHREFTFALNFVAAADVHGSNLIPFDPGGTNTNGGTDPLTDSISSTVIIGAVAAVAVLAVAYLTLR